jgi:O-antigen/teichoic acid export membrane protein
LKNRILRLSKLATKFATGQAVLQLFQAANGLVFVWLLSVQDFAVYAVFTGAMGFASQLAGFGIAPSIVSLVGMGMADPEKVGRYIAAGLRLRWILLLWILPIGTLLLWIASEKAGISSGLFIASAVCLAACGYLTAQADLFGLPLKMLDRLGTIYRISIQSELLRLFLVSIAWSVGWLNAMSAIVISTCGLLYNFLALKRSSARHICLPDQPVHREARELVKIFLPKLPNAIFGAFQGQITIVLSAIFGGVSQIASIGALGRLSRLLGFLTAANPMLVGPAISRMSERAFWRRIPWMLALGAAIGAAIACTGILRPEWLLFVLGTNYSGLASVVWIVTLTAGLSFFVQLVHTVVSYKRWVAWWASFGTIGMVLLFQIVVVWNFNVTTTVGVLLLGLAAVSARAVSLLFVIFAAKFRPSWMIGA